MEYFEPQICCAYVYVMLADLKFSNLCSDRQYRHFSNRKKRVLQYVFQKYQAYGIVLMKGCTYMQWNPVVRWERFEQVVVSGGLPFEYVDDGRTDDGWKTG